MNILWRLRHWFTKWQGACVLDEEFAAWQQLYAYSIWKLENDM